MSRLLFMCLLLATAISLSCKKPDPFPKAPIAKAGADITLLLPVDSVMLEGSASYDPDGQVVAYLWTQLSGPSAADILSPDNAKARANRLQPGAYLFELTVKDNSGLPSKDTVVVTVHSTPTVRIQANAGSDQVIELSAARATLSGTASADSSGLPLSYHWRQIAGPTSQLLNNSLAIATAVFSVPNVYRFELKVWNANGEAYDTTQITVKDCVMSRTEVPAQLTPLKQFAFSPYNTARLLAVGNKLIIPVDVHDPIAVSAVFVYDVATGTIIQKELNTPRLGSATAVAGNKVFFAGGFTDFNDEERPAVTDIVDIYDVASDTWSTAKLSQARGAIKAGAVGNKVVFAGGLNSNVLSNQVDIYDLQTAQWTTSVMAGPPRAVERVVADGSSIYFLGGYTGWGNPMGFFGFDFTGSSKTIDIYNAASGTWSTANMHVERYGFSAVLVDDKILIAGGVEGFYPNGRMTSNVEIITLPTMQRSNSCLADATVWYGVEATTMRNGSALFYLGQSIDKRKFNIYNPQTGAWSLGVHDFDVLGQYESAALASLNNQVYVLKGNTLFKLEY